MGRKESHVKTMNMVHAELQPPAFFSHHRRIASTALEGACVALLIQSPLSPIQNKTGLLHAGIRIPEACLPLRRLSGAGSADWGGWQPGALPRPTGVGLQMCMLERGGEPVAQVREGMSGWEEGM